MLWALVLFEVVPLALVRLEHHLATVELELAVEVFDVRVQILNEPGIIGERIAGQ